MREKRAQAPAASAPSACGGRLIAEPADYAIAARPLAGRSASPCPTRP